MKRKILGFGTVVFFTLFIVFAGRLFCWYMDGRKSQEAFEQVTRLLYDTTLQEKRETDRKTEESDSDILSCYRAVYEQNPDFIGWISIEDTNINYPVMQSADEPDFYLNHNFDREESGYGVPYLQADCDFMISDNLVIYGHHMKNGSMFADLCRYEEESFYDTHKTICFDTRYRYGIYEIIAVFQTADTEDGFPYYQFVNAESEQDFQDYITACKSLSLYEIEMTAQYGDRLLTLSTCEYSRTDGRMVIVAKQV